MLALLFIVAMLNYLDRTMITTMRGSIVAAIPITDTQYGLLTSVFSWVYGLFCPLAGFIADRFKKTYVIIGSLFVWSGVTWLTGYVTTYEELFATRALMGISEAFYIPTALSLIVEHHKGRTQSLAIGILFSGEMIGQSLGFLGGWLAEQYVWNSAFRLFGLSGILYAVFLIFTLKEPDADTVVQDKKVKQNDKKIRITDALKTLFAKKAFYLLLLLYPLPSIVSWMIMGWLPTYYQEQFHLSQSDAGLYATAYLYPASIVGLLLGGFISDKWHKTNPYARILVPIIGFALSAPCIIFASCTGILTLAIALFLVYGLARMFVDTNLMPILCMVIDGRYRATGYGIINMLTVIAGGMSAYVAGSLRDIQVNLGIMYQIASIGLILCIGILYLIKREIKHKNDETK
jgi:MFS family permease